MRFTFKEIHLNFIKDNINGISYKELARIFFKKFAYKSTINSLRCFCSKYKIKNNRNTQFKTGVKSVGKIFKKGHKRTKRHPIGTERVRNNFTYIKIKEPSHWKLKHLVVYESAFGKIPENHAVLFLDGNRLNFDLSNLKLVSRREQLMFYLKYGDIDVELKNTAMNLVKLESRLFENKRSCNAKS